MGGGGWRVEGERWPLQSLHSGRAHHILSLLCAPLLHSRLCTTLEILASPPEGPFSPFSPSCSRAEGVGEGAAGGADAEAGVPCLPPSWQCRCLRTR